MLTWCLGCAGAEQFDDEVAARPVGDVGDRVRRKAIAADSAVGDQTVVDVLKYGASVDLRADGRRLRVQDHVIVQVAVRGTGLARVKTHDPHSEPLVLEQHLRPDGCARFDLGHSGLLSDSLDQTNIRLRMNTVAHPYGGV
jgi:hypothetical protein